MGVLPAWLQPASLQQFWTQQNGWQAAQLFELPSWWRREQLPSQGIDLGHGHVLPPEDVLEGHYRRLAKQREPASHLVAVQVGENLTVAITVLAPDLAPLAEVAEQVSGIVPLVEPAPQFREHLHQALERTHRQHAAERILGTRPTPHAQTTPQWAWWMALVGIAATLALWWGWRTQHSDAPAA